MEKMVDYRCPDCNRELVSKLKGKSPVVHQSNKPPAELTCPHCGCKAKLVKDEDNELGSLCDSEEYDYE